MINTSNPEFKRVSERASDREITVNLYCRTFWNINDYDLRQLIAHYQRSVEQIANNEMKRNECALDNYNRIKNAMDA